METDPERLRANWRQRKLPVILRQGHHPLMVKLPGNPNDVMWRVSAGHWLKAGRRNSPKWNHRYRCWEVPQAWLNSVVQQVLHGFKKMYLIQPYREQEKCAPSCFNAKDHDCQCSCMGAKHGQGGPEAGKFVVSDTCASRGGEAYLACRLMELRR